MTLREQASERLTEQVLDDMLAAWAPRPMRDVLLDAIQPLFDQVEREQAALQDEIAEAREACPSVRMQDHFDAPLLKLINNEVSRGFNRDAELVKVRAKLAQAEARLEQAMAALDRG